MKKILWQLLRIGVWLPGKIGLMIWLFQLWVEEQHFKRNRRV